MPDRASAHSTDYVVCVPARNEVERLPRLLKALAGQDVPGVVPVVVTINNSSDGSAECVRAARDRYAGRLDIICDEQVFEARNAHAGMARRRAMDQGLARLASNPAGVLISTDADATPPQGWIAANLRAIAGGADVVGGAIRLADTDDLPADLVRYHAMLARYWGEVRGIEDAIDPVAWDLPPRHGDHTGASLAITASAYVLAGGVPPIPTGEDRGLVQAALAGGARLVHPVDVWVYVSAREDGRAVGGMAEAMRGLHADIARGKGPMVPPFDAWEERARWRLGLRHGSGQGPDGARRIATEEALLPPMPETLSLLDHYGAR